MRTGTRFWRDEPQSVKPLLKTISARATRARSNPALPVRKLPLPEVGGCGGGGGIVGGAVVVEITVGGVGGVGGVGTVGVALLKSLTYEIPLLCHPLLSQ